MVENTMVTLRAVHDLGCVCGRHFRRPLFHALDVTEQPGLRYALLAGVLNAAQCPSCERSTTVDLPFLYSDEARGHLFRVYPDGAGADDAGAEGAEEGAWAAAGAPDGPPWPPPWPWDVVRRPARMDGVGPLAELIMAELGEDEQPGSVLFDVRPGVKSERAARVLAGRIAVEVGGYVHSWREGGRLHIDVLGPAARLEAIRVVGD